MGRGSELLLLCVLVSISNALETKPSGEPVKSVSLENHDSAVLPTHAFCGKIKETPKIFGGVKAQLGEFPWMVGLQYKSATNDKDSETIKCGGSLINNRWILTAANCLSSHHLIPEYAVLGEWNLSTNPDCVSNDCADLTQKVKIHEYIKHPMYTIKSGENDIGLVGLEKDVSFTEFISPVCLPPKNLPFLQEGNLVTVVGWGKTEQDKLSDILLKVELPVTSSEDCGVKLRRTVGRNRFCAGGEKGKDACQGDSGGPAVRVYEDDTNDGRWYQYGIVSLGAKCGLSGYSGVYTSVDQYMDWIVSTIQTRSTL